MKINKNKFRILALHTLFEPTSLEEAINKLKFIQADPIRSPARAQDLILRHRVIDYHTGDLEKKFIELEIEEDYLYQYGFLKREVSHLWHPIKAKGLTTFDKQVLIALEKLGPVHPKDLAKHLGSKSVRNWWGGKSQASKHSLDILHWWGQVRVVRREKGIRIYEKRNSIQNQTSIEDRKKELVMTVINLLAPITEKKLSEALHRFRHIFKESKEIVNKLVKTGELTKEKVDGINYLWPTEKKFSEKPHKGVKFLAPFDPVVWDRNRFEHLWGWQYRFEAYTPPAKRIRGYYAMPLLWNEDMIGWANINKKDNNLNVDLGFVNKRPTSKSFDIELEKEIESLKKFLIIY